MRGTCLHSHNLRESRNTALVEYSATAAAAAAAANINDLFS